jgi:hypothetical protein
MLKDLNLIEPENDLSRGTKPLGLHYDKMVRSCFVTMITAEKRLTLRNIIFVMLVIEPYVI